jgi:hypothetical protein
MLENSSKRLAADERRLTQMEDNPLIGVHLRSSAAEYAFSVTCTVHETGTSRLAVCLP